MRHIFYQFLLITNLIIIPVQQPLLAMRPPAPLPVPTSVFDTMAADFMQSLSPTSVPAQPTTQGIIDALTVHFIQNDETSIEEFKTALAILPQFDLNAYGSLHKTLLHLAIDYQKVDIISLLLTCGVNVNAPRLDHPHQGETPLYAAIWSGDFTVARELLHHGANPDIRPQYSLSLRRMLYMPRHYPQRFRALKECDEMAEILDRFAASRNLTR